MSISFDDLTLAEVELVSQEALGGKAISDDDSDPLMVAAGVMWVTQKRQGSEVSFADFKQTVTMRQIKEFSAQLEAAADDPLGMSMNGRPSSVPTSVTSGT